MKTQYTQEDVERGHAWFIAHKPHVLALINSARGHMYPMEGSDIEHPELWKAPAWNWFIQRYGKPD